MICLQPKAYCFRNKFYFAYEHLHRTLLMGDQATHPYKKSMSHSRSPFSGVQLVGTQREETAKRNKEENTFSLMNSLILSNCACFSWELHSLIYFNISNRITQLIIAGSPPLIDILYELTGTLLFSGDMFSKITINMINIQLAISYLQY